ncbi:MAG: recombination mediator RecR [Spirochaetia bacterium]
MKVLDEFVNAFSRLPGIGRKTAQRLAYHFLQVDQNVANSYTDHIHRLRAATIHCITCGCYSEQETCPFCNNTSREHHILCVVAWPQDAANIEASRAYKGVYHVLSGVISPLEGVGPEDLCFELLQQRIEEEKIQEVIIATNLSPEGDATALYIQRLLQNFPVKISRIASGLPVGSELEYADQQTLGRSLRGRTPL